MSSYLTKPQWKIYTPQIQMNIPYCNWPKDRNFNAWDLFPKASKKYAIE